MQIKERPVNYLFYRTETVCDEVASTVLVFSTSVRSKREVGILAPILNSFVGVDRWNFALDDSDKILRIVSEEVKPTDAIQLLQECGFECNELED